MTLGNENSIQALQAGGDASPPGPVQSLEEAIRNLHASVTLVERDGNLVPIPDVHPVTGTGTLAHAPPCPLENLGDASFRRDHGLRYAYVAGAMAGGISSVDLVEAVSRAGMLGIFGAAGLPLESVEAAVDRITSDLGDLPYGFNLIHSPGDPDLEAAVADLYLRRKIRCIEASAYLDLTLPVVRYRVQGIHTTPEGTVVVPNRILAKVSRVEIAEKFLSPPPDKYLQALVAKGVITTDQAGLATRIPMADDLTAEADSGGHTDNRPAITLIPTLVALRDRMQSRFRYARPPRIGAAGGLATPASVAAALSMGAAYVLTGSVNQACVESGTSDAVRAMLAEAGQADFAMAPAADMFEMGVKIQVLKRGTLFPMRATRLYELYRTHESLDSIPAADRDLVEKKWFRASFEDVWKETRRYFSAVNPGTLARAEREPKHKMALVFRWYLGNASRWAVAGDPDRRIDYQIWCGPALGAFNEWVKGSCLEAPAGRRVVDVALNLLLGASLHMRLAILRLQGVSLASDRIKIIPMESADLRAACSYEG